MSANKLEEKIKVHNEDSSGAQEQQKIEGQQHSPSVDNNLLHIPVQPKHTIQDEIVELNQSIQKKRNSQRKSVFSNHEDMHLTELAKEFNQEQEQQANQVKENSPLVKDKENSEGRSKQLGGDERKEQTDSHQKDDHEDDQEHLPYRPKHTVQDDIKELNDQIVQRKSERRASRFSAESSNHLHALINDQLPNSSSSNQNAKNEDKQNSSEGSDNEDEEDQNKIKSLHELTERDDEDGSQQVIQKREVRDGEHQDEGDREEGTEKKQKSISELQEEAKQKPNALNEVIKLSSQIQIKRGLKRKSTFSQSTIQNEDLEEDGQKKKNEGKEKSTSSHELSSSPTKEKKPNAYDEIIKLNNDIHFRSNLKRKSTFSLPVINDEDMEEDGKSEACKIKVNEEEIKINEDPSMEEKGEKEEEGDEQQGGENHGKKPNAYVEILKMNNDINVKRQLTRKSTFSLPVHLDDEDEGEQKNQEKSEDKNEDEMQSQPSSTSLQQNINENSQVEENQKKDSEGEQEQAQQKKPNAYQDIMTLNNQITVKRTLTRKSTFSQTKIEDEQQETKSNKEENSKITEESQLDAAENAQQKHNPLNEILDLNKEISIKRSSKKKSTFSLPQIEDGDEQQKDNNNKVDINPFAGGETEEQKKNNALNEIISLNNQIQVKRDSRRKSTFSHSNILPEELTENYEKSKSQNIIENEKVEDQDQEDNVDESEEAKLLRQGKKKNLMDYKQQEADHPVMKAQRDQSQGKKNVFLSENQQHYRKVIHAPKHLQQNNQLQQQNNNVQPNKKELEENQLEVNKQVNDQNVEQEEEADELQQEQGVVEEQGKSANNSFDKAPINDDLQQASPEKSTKPNNKQPKNERRDEFTLQRKLEYLTAKQAKNELLRKEKGGIPHNKFMVQELSKELKIREANKRKRELESMLAQINREIQFIRNSDPDYDSLTQNNLHIKSLQEDKERSQSNHLYGSIPAQNTKSAGVILPVIKKNNQIKEMIKISENNQANHNAVSLIHKYKREKEEKRQKREEEFHQMNDQIYKEVELRRQQNESLQEKIILERRQKLVHKKQQIESKKQEQQALLVASKQFLKDIRYVGQGKNANSQYQQQVNQIDNEYKFGQYQTPELDAHKLGLQQIRNLAKGEMSVGGPLPNFMKSKNNDNQDLKKLLEENQINRDREMKISESRKDLYNKRMDYSKSVKNNFLRGGRKLEISSNLLFQDDAIKQNSSTLQIDSKKRKQNDNDYEEQNGSRVQQENINIGNSASTKSINSNKVWRVLKH